MIYYLFCKKGSFKENLILGTNPSESWGPGDMENRTEWKKFVLKARKFSVNSIINGVHVTKF